LWTSIAPIRSRIAASQRGVFFLHPVFKPSQRIVEAATGDRVGQMGIATVDAAREKNTAQINFAGNGEMAVPDVQSGEQAHDQRIGL